MADPRFSNYIFENSLRRHGAFTDLIGPFYRQRSRTQTADDDRKITESGILFGDTPRGGKCPTVQAYFGPLPAYMQGIQFVTATIPHQTGLPPGFGANWYLEDTAFTAQVNFEGRSMAAITIVVMKRQV